MVAYYKKQTNYIKGLRIIIFFYLTFKLYNYKMITQRLKSKNILSLVYIILNQEFVDGYLSRNKIEKKARLSARASGADNPHSIRLTNIIFIVYSKKYIKGTFGPLVSSQNIDLAYPRRTSEGKRGDYELYLGSQCNSRAAIIMSLKPSLAFTYPQPLIQFN